MAAEHGEFGGTGASEGWKDMVATLRPHGLPVPPVPAALRPRVTRLGRWYWGTPPEVRPMEPPRTLDPAELYGFRPSLVERLLGDGSRERVLLCHAGQGTDSYAVTYALVHRGLVLLTQVGWGGAHMDNTAQAEALAAVFRRCQALVDAAGARAAEPGRFLVAVESELRGTALCGWAPPERAVRHLARVPTGTALAEAERLLTGDGDDPGA